MTEDGRPRHPLAVPGVVLAAMGIVPLTVVGGLFGALLGAIAGAAARRDPATWRPSSAADAAVSIGAVTGLLPLAVLGAVKMDDWGPVPLVAATVYAAVLGAIVVSGIRGAKHAAAGAAAGVAVAGGGTLLVAGLALAVIWFFILLGRLFWRAVFG